MEVDNGDGIEVEEELVAQNKEEEQNRKRRNKTPPNLYESDQYVSSDDETKPKIRKDMKRIEIQQEKKIMMDTKKEWLRLYEERIAEKERKESEKRRRDQDKMLEARGWKSEEPLKVHQPVILEEKEDEWDGALTIEPVAPAERAPAPDLDPEEADADEWFFQLPPPRGLRAPHEVLRLMRPEYRLQRLRIRPNGAQGDPAPEAPGWPRVLPGAQRELPAGIPELIQELRDAHNRLRPDEESDSGSDISSDEAISDDEVMDDELNLEAFRPFPNRPPGIRRRRRPRAGGLADRIILQQQQEAAANEREEERELFFPRIAEILGAHDRLDSSDDDDSDEEDVQFIPERLREDSPEPDLELVAEMRPHFEENRGRWGAEARIGALAVAAILRQQADELGRNVEEPDPAPLESKPSTPEPVAEYHWHPPIRNDRFYADGTYGAVGPDGMPMRGILRKGCSPLRSAVLVTRIQPEPQII